MNWSSAKANQVLAALFRIGWSINGQVVALIAFFNAPDGLISFSHSMIATRSAREC
jgi:hypothetical protein